MLCSAASSAWRRPRRHPHPARRPAGRASPFVEALGIEPDVLYDLEINPNRPDAMSVAGVARDLAARLRRALHPARRRRRRGRRRRAGRRGVAVEIVDPDLCGRFVARVLRGVTVGPSPTRGSPPAHACSACGRSTSVVDVSNYVMLELGQPNHPYDLAKVARRRPAGAPGPAGRDASSPSTASSATLHRRRPAHLRRRRPADRHRRRDGRRRHRDRRRRPPPCCWRWPGSCRSPSPRRRAACGCAARRRPGSSGAPTPRSSTWPQRRFAELLAPSGARLERRHGRRAGRAARTGRRCGCAPPRLNRLLGTDLDGRRDRRAARAHRLRRRRSTATTRRSAIPSVALRLRRPRST